MLVSTTTALEGKRVVQYLGLVGWEAILIVAERRFEKEHLSYL